MQIGGDEKTKMRDRGKQKKFSCIYKVVRAWGLGGVSGANADVKVMKILSIL